VCHTRRGFRQEANDVFEGARVVTIVDDDASVRRAFARLLAENGYEVHTFASALDLLDDPASTLTESGCLLVDVRMPEMSGLQLQAVLAGRERAAPVVFMTGCCDEQTRAKALKAGAVGVLVKPFTEEELLAAVNGAASLGAEVREWLRTTENGATR
jgi:FixJ family two-component response regulator